MFHYQSSSRGRDLCLQTSWYKGHNSGFSDYEHFCTQANRMVEEAGCEEITVYNESLEPVAYLALQLCASFHRPYYGLSVYVSAVRSDLEGDLKLSKYILQVIREIAIKEDCKWYERSKHVSQTIIQTIIKEI